MIDFADLPRGHFGAVLADPPWHFQSWTSGRWNGGRKIFTPAKAPDYPTIARRQRCGWTVWGNETSKFGEAAE